MLGKILYDISQDVLVLDWVSLSKCSNRELDPINRDSHLLKDLNILQNEVKKSLTFTNDIQTSPKPLKMPKITFHMIGKKSVSSHACIHRIMIKERWYTIDFSHKLYSCCLKPTASFFKNWWCSSQKIRICEISGI